MKRRPVSNIYIPIRDSNQPSRGVVLVTGMWSKGKWFHSTPEMHVSWTVGLTRFEWKC